MRGMLGRAICRPVDAFSRIEGTPGPQAFGALSWEGCRTAESSLSFPYRSC